jgi:hypothetical protein
VIARALREVLHLRVDVPVVGRVEGLGNVCEIEVLDGRSDLQRLDERRLPAGELLLLAEERELRGLGGAERLPPSTAVAAVEVQPGCVPPAARVSRFPTA